MIGVVWWTCALFVLVSGRHYDQCELARELYNYAIDPEYIPTWVCIAYHESRLDTTARNPNTGDHGIFQISELYWCGAGKACGVTCDKFRDDDIRDDIECILQIHEEHSRIQNNGFMAWVVYPLYCTHDTEKYVAGCDYQSKDAPVNNLRTFYELDQCNNSGRSFPRPQIEDSLPSYLAIRDFLKRKYGNLVNYNQGPTENWVNYKLDNIDDLRLPQFNEILPQELVYVRPSMIPTTESIEKFTAVPYVPRVKTWRYIESNEFRKKIKTYPKLESTNEVNMYSDDSNYNLVLVSSTTKPTISSSILATTTSPITTTSTVKSTIFSTTPTTNIKPSQITSSTRNWETWTKRDPVHGSTTPSSASTSSRQQEIWENWTSSPTSYSITSLSYKNPSSQPTISKTDSTYWHSWTKPTTKSTSISSTPWYSWTKTSTRSTTPKTYSTKLDSWTRLPTQSSSTRITLSPWNYWNSSIEHSIKSTTQKSYFADWNSSTRSPTNSSSTKMSQSRWNSWSSSTKYSTQSTTLKSSSTNWDLSTRSTTQPSSPWITLSPWNTWSTTTKPSTQSNTPKSYFSDRVSSTISPRKSSSPWNIWRTSTKPSNQSTTQKSYSTDWNSSTKSPSHSSSTRITSSLWNSWKTSKNPSTQSSTPTSNFNDWDSSTKSPKQSSTTRKTVSPWNSWSSWSSHSNQSASTKTNPTNWNSSISPSKIKTTTTPKPWSSISTTSIPSTRLTSTTKDFSSTKEPYLVSVPGEEKVPNVTLTTEKYPPKTNTSISSVTPPESPKRGFVTLIHLSSTNKPTPTTEKSISSIKSAPETITQSIFDLYLNPSRKSTVFSQRLSSNNDKIKLRIFPDSTTTPKY